MNQLSVNEKNKKLESLQLLRGVAAALVVYVHAFDTYREKVDESVNLHTSIGLGELGVKIFFCISGFIIFESLRTLSQGKPSAILFFQKRLIRIIPLYWLATLIYAIKLTLIGSPPSTKEIILSLAFIPYPDIHGLMRPIIGAGWTLNYEMLFYFAAAVTVYFSPNTRAPLLALFIGTLASHEGTIALGISPLMDAASLITSHYLLFFLAGIICSAASRLPALEKLHSGSLTVLLLPVILVFSFISTTNLQAPTDKIRLAITLLFCIACVLVATIHSDTTPLDKIPLTKRILRRFSLAVGDGSYATYLSHGFVMGPCARIIHYADLSLSPTPFAIAMVILCTTFGVAIHKYIESPIQTRLTRKLRKISPNATVK